MPNVSFTKWINYFEEIRANSFPHLLGLFATIEHFYFSRGFFSVDGSVLQTTTPRCRLFQQLALSQSVSNPVPALQTQHQSPSPPGSWVHSSAATGEGKRNCYQKTMLCARTTPRPFRAGQTIAGRGPGGERVLAFAGTLARPHTAVAGLQGAAWALRTSVYLLPQLRKINPCPQGSPEGSAPPTAARQHPRRGLLPALRGTCPGAAVPVLAPRKARPPGLRVCARAWGAPLTCKHTRGKGDAQHRRPDGHFFGHAEKRHFGAGSERLGSTERPAQVHAVRSARPARAGPRWPWVAALRLPGSSRGILRSPRPAVPHAGVATGWVTRGRCAPFSWWHTRLGCVK